MMGQDYILAGGEINEIRLFIRSIAALNGSNFRTPPSTTIMNKLNSANIPLAADDVKINTDSITANIF